MVSDRGDDTLHEKGQRKIFFECERLRYQKRDVGNSRLVVVITFPRRNTDRRGNRKRVFKREGESKVYIGRVAGFALQCLYVRAIDPCIPIDSERDDALVLVAKVELKMMTTVNGIALGALVVIAVRTVQSAPPKVSNRKGETLVGITESDVELLDVSLRVVAKALRAPEREKKAFVG